MTAATAAPARRRTTGAIVRRIGCPLLALLAGCDRAQGRPAAEPPALVVLITVDQLRPDYVDRFAADLKGGFARLAREGTFFTDAWQDYAMTSTAPGHATLWSGRHPAHTGILSNDLGVPDAAHPLVGATGPGASPARFRGSAFYDWLRSADPDARALSVSRKDRGAILPVGSARVPTFWWSSQGLFTTSTYYADALPAWLVAWNARLAAADWRDRDWSPALPESAYPEPDAPAWEGSASGLTPGFPHRLASIRALPDFPWMDSLTLDVALTGARALGLGGRAGTDVLAVSLSTLDAVGHAFGPGSREVHDHFVRLDGWLGDFMDALEREHPGRRVLYVLSSDHGIGPMPEASGEGGYVDLARPLAALSAPLRQRYGSGAGLVLQDGIVVADTAALAARGVDVARLAARVAEALAAVEGVARTYTPRTLAVAPAEDEAAGRWRRSIPPEYGWLAVAEPAEGWMLGRAGVAHHGTPLVENLRVPVFFLGEGIPARRVDRRIRTVDVAPTLAALLGIRPIEAVDGTALAEVLGAS